MKTCAECGKEKPFKAFYVHKGNAGGHRPNCRICMAKLRSMTSEEKIAYKDEKKVIRELQRKEKYELQKQKRLEQYRANPEKFALYQKQRNANMTDEQKAIRRKKWKEYKQKRSQKDPLFAMSETLRSRLAMAFTNGGWKKPCKTEKMVGCTFSELHAHLINTALKRYGYWIDIRGYFHIDHIVPISTAKNVDELIKLNHYSNLQYLLPADNLSKSDSV